MEITRIHRINSYFLWKPINNIAISETKLTKKDGRHKFLKDVERGEITEKSRKHGKIPRYMLPAKIKMM